jgi:putative phosphoesterase
LKIAVLSDTHLPARLQNLPGAVYEACADADLIIHAGDIEEKSVIEDLERFAPVKAVHGNMDGMDTYQRYPAKLILHLEGFIVALTHGSGASYGIRNRIKEKFKSEEPHIIIHGHTHEYFWKKENGIWFLNPGAVAGSKGRRSMAILTLVNGKEPEAVKVAF